MTDASQAQPDERLPRIAVLASHEGSVLQAVIDACASRRLAARVIVVVSNNSGSGALQRAAATGIRTAHLSTHTHPDLDELDRAMANLLQDQQANVVLLAGYMKRLGPITLEEFSGHIINTHPSLLPRFGGQGFYGRRVHEAVLAAGEKHSGATVHVVEDDYDAGPIIAQRTVDVHPDDTPEQLEQRVQACERELLIDALDELLANQYQIEQ
jgi:phosphoribosylglycinamide formyltransferase-1